MPLKQGLVQVYTGDGKGKTTAAMGLGLRAVGAGLSVYMIQFMKGRRYSEIDAIEKIKGFTVVQFGRDEFVSKKDPEKIDMDLARKGLDHAKKIIKDGKSDVVILDEINVALDYNLVSLEEVLQLVKGKPANMELILTGRYAPKGLMDIADLVTNVGEVKHPYQKGMQSRKGIDW
jgi:cob(I)alamin adenosyltransferase